MLSELEMHDLLLWQREECCADAVLLCLSFFPESSCAAVVRGKEVFVVVDQRTFSSKIVLQEKTEVHFPKQRWKQAAFQNAYENASSSYFGMRKTSTKLTGKI